MLSHLAAAVRCAALLLLTISATGATVAEAHAAPIVTVEDGAVRGAVVPGGYAFRGLPYAAAPTDHLRWRAPRAPAGWHGVRDATKLAPSCPQSKTPFTPPPTAEDCLYLNVSTPALRGGARPVLVWLHGGGLTLGSGGEYDATKLAAEGPVVVTVNYRLGALGFLAHPALASPPGGPSGNYGLMDQQAALRWVRRNIRGFGGDPGKVTIAGQSAGGLSVLAHLVSRRSRGLFQRAIVQSGAFALHQRSLATAEASGEAFAADVGCADQSAACLRRVPVGELVGKFPGGAAIPGVVDGAVLGESIGRALAGGRFARVPVLNGVAHDEERLVLPTGASVTGGTFVPLPEPVTAESYRRVIASVLGETTARAATIAAEYPVDAYATPEVAFSTLDSDANLACPALEVDRWTSKRVPTFAYQFDDDAAPARFGPPLTPPAEATHQSELQYLFDLPNAFAGTLTPEQETLAARMRAAWASFAAGKAPWASFGAGRVLSLRTPRPRLETDFAARHHCGFWSM
jgi:para-nitrobenzyl esterase